MKYSKIFALILVVVVVFSGCGKVKIDENAVNENNATACVTYGENVFELKDDSIYMNDGLLAENIGTTDDFIVVLGDKVYFNTEEGTKYFSLTKGKIKDFGNGRIIYARGEWLYYQIISLFAVNADDGKYIMLHDPMLEYKEDTGSKIIFTDGEKDYSLKYDGRTLNEE